MWSRRPVLDKHFWCDRCGPLVHGETRAICGAVIPVQVAGSGPERKCPACKTAMRQHKASHRR